MKPYFEKMPQLGKELKDNRRTRTQDSRVKLEVGGGADRRRAQGAHGGRHSGRDDQQARRADGMAAPRLSGRQGHLSAAALALQPRGQRGRHHQRRRRPRPDQRALGGHHRLRQQGAGGRLASRPGRQHPARHQSRQAAAHPAGLAGQLQRRENARPGEVLRLPPRRRHRVLPPCRTGAGGRSDPRRHLGLEPGGRRLSEHLARPSCSPTRTPISRSAASASSPACRPRAASTSRAWRN